MTRCSCHLCQLPMIMFGPEFEHGVATHVCPVGHEVQLERQGDRFTCSIPVGGYYEEHFMRSQELREAKEESDE